MHQNMQQNMQQNLYDIMHNTIINTPLNPQNKQNYLQQLQTAATNTKPQEILRGIISNPIINSNMPNLGFNPSAIMRDTYKPAFSFKKNDDTQEQQSQNQSQIPKPVNKQNIKNAVIITKEQETGIGKEGDPEIISSSIRIVQKAKKFNKLNDQKIPINNNQPFKFSDQTPLLDEKIVNPRIPFSKKLSPNVKG
jgi:hypothetical protein